MEAWADRPRPGFASCGTIPSAIALSRKHCCRPAFVSRQASELLCGRPRNPAEGPPRHPWSQTAVPRLRGLTVAQPTGNAASLSGWREKNDALRSKQALASRCLHWDRKRDDQAVRPDRRVHRLCSGHLRPSERCGANALLRFSLSLSAVSVGNTSSRAKPQQNAAARQHLAATPTRASDDRQRNPARGCGAGIRSISDEPGRWAREAGVLGDAAGASPSLGVTLVAIEPPGQ